MTSRGAAHVEAARLMLAQEGGARETAPERAEAAVRVYERLSEVLSPLLGAAGVRALFARSVKVTNAEVSCFAEVHVSVELPDDACRQLLASLSKLEPALASEAAAALYANFLELLTAFVGDRLVWQVLRGAFPAIDQSGPKEMDG